MIKVSDFGLTEDIYARNYFRQGRDGEDGEAPVKLPVKWMAVESLNDGVFSEKTDIVSISMARMGGLRTYCIATSYSAVVVWCDVLGGVLTGENPLPWSGPIFPHQVSGESRATGKTSQCCLLPRNVSDK